jgi:hypothetical protein
MDRVVGDARARARKITELGHRDAIVRCASGCVVLSKRVSRKDVAESPRRLFRKNPLPAGQAASCALRPAENELCALNDGRRAWGHFSGRLPALASAANPASRAL